LISVPKYLIFGLIAGLAFTTMIISFLPLQRTSAIYVSHDARLATVANGSTQATQPSLSTSAGPGGAIAAHTPSLITLPAPASFQVEISNLPHQTAPADTFIPLEIIDPNDESGSSTIFIPAIGPGVVTISLFMGPEGAVTYFVDVENLPGQTGHSHETTFTPQDVFVIPNHSRPIEIPGIGVGQVELFPAH
jgi:hypothetical protein